MLKSIIVMLFFFFPIASGRCGEKPLMSADMYWTYRMFKDVRKDNSSYLNKFRLPTEEEKRMYVYADYDDIDYDSQDKVPVVHLRSICKWLMEDDPEKNISFITRFILEQDKEIKRLQAEHLIRLQKKESVVQQSIVSLGDYLGSNALPYYIEFLNADSEALHKGACWGIEQLFEKDDIDIKEKNKWVNDILKALSDSIPGQASVARLLLHLHDEGRVHMQFNDLIWLYVRERQNLLVSEFEYVLKKYYLEQFEEWKRSQGFSTFNIE